VTIRGRLPAADGLSLKKTVEAYANQVKLSRAGWDQDSDPESRRPSKAQLMADGLVAAAERAAQAPGGPTLGGSQPTLVVSCDLDNLKAGVNDAALEDAETGRPLTAGELRRLACSAGVVPWVMGAGSEVLDWGKTRRLAPPGLREALAARDGGCVFYGCAQPAGNCDVHHLTPFWAVGGSTGPAGCVTLCRHHHQLVEPAHLADAERVEPDPERWEICLIGGLPHTVPPARVDWGRTPRLHQRHQHRQHQPGRPPPGGDPPHTPDA
jgi:hypothetical protein